MIDLNVPKEKVFAAKITLGVAVVALAILGAWAVSQRWQSVEQPALAIGATTPLGVALTQAGVVELQFNPGTWSIDRHIKLASGASEDLSFECLKVCGVFQTIVGPWMDGFTLRRRGNDFIVLANINREETPAGMAAETIEAATRSTLQDLKAKQDIRASWK